MTLHLEDARWRAAVDASLLGEATDEQTALLATSTPRGEAHQAEAEFLAALAAEPAVEDADETPAWLDAAVEAFGADATPAPAPTQRPQRLWWPWVAAAAALALTVGAGAWLARTPETEPPAETVATAPTASEQPAPSWTVQSGQATAVPTAASTDDPLPIGQRLEVETELCASRPSHTVCAATGSEVTARASGALALHQGVATVRTRGTAADVVVELDATLVVEASANSVVVIEQRTSGWSVTVDEGSATVVELGSRRAVQAGESLRRDAAPDGVESGPNEPEATPRTRRPTAKASTMLAQARAHRRDGDVDAAMQTYARLIARHRRSPAAQTARVSLGQLQLAAGKAKAALRNFRAYRSRGGALAEDAAYGEIRALRALGRSSEAKRAAAAFVKAYPQSPYGAKLKR